jgi:hypothetical protein
MFGGSQMSIVENLRAEIERREDELNALRRALGVLEGSNTNGEFAGRGIPEAAADVIREIGPQTTRNLAETLLQRGIKTRSKNFPATVNATLANSGEFVRAGKRWCLVEPRPEEVG